MKKTDPIGTGDSGAKDNRSPEMKETPTLTDEQVRFIEARFVLREKEEASRAALQRKAFWIALPAGLVAAVLSNIAGLGILAVALWLAYVVGTLIFADFFPLPRSAAQDSDVRWHFNPWREGLERLKDERLIPAIALLALPNLLWFILRELIDLRG